MVVYIIVYNAQFPKFYNVTEHQCVLSFHNIALLSQREKSKFRSGYLSIDNVGSCTSKKAKKFNTAGE